MDRQTHDYDVILRVRMTKGQSDRVQQLAYITDRTQAAVIRQLIDRANMSGCYDIEVSTENLESIVENVETSLGILQRLLAKIRQ